MQILSLHSYTGDPEKVHILLAPDDMAYPDDVANLVIRRVADANPDFNWENLRGPLEAKGFVEPSKVGSAIRPWDESRANQHFTFKVRFPATALHEHAGKELHATNAIPFEDGKLVLIDENQQFLNADDQLWHQARPYIEQVPLGAVELPDQQFATPAEFKRAANLLQASGFTLANKVA